MNKFYEETRNIKIFPSEKCCFCIIYKYMDEAANDIQYTESFAALRLWITFRKVNKFMMNSVSLCASL